MRRLDPLAIALEGRQLVEASAGTGKTYAITTLFLRLVVERQLPVERILVVTFTNAATAELRDRVRRRLAEAAQAFAHAARGKTPDDEVLAGLARSYAGRQGGLDRARALVVAAIHSMDEAAISTIHGFCQRVLVTQAFASGARFDLELVAQPGPLVREVVEDFWADRFYAASESRVRYAMEHQGSVPGLLPLARVAADFRDVPVIPRVPSVDPDRALAAYVAARERAGAVWRVERETVRHVLATSPALNRQTHPKDKTDERCAGIDAIFDDAIAGVDRRVAALGRYATGAIKHNKGTRAPENPFFDACRDWVAAFEAASAAFEDWLIGEKQDLIETVRRELPRRKLAAGVQSFDDLLYGLRDAVLGKSGALLLKQIREQYPAALIDEFQDTDPVQYEVFRQIYAGAGSTLFLIGDPKQAIYAFRGADIFAYLGAAADAGDGAWTLGTNYRSDPGLVAAQNCLWSRVAQPFALERIDYAEVDARPGAKDRLVVDGRSATPFEIVFIPRAGRTGKKGRVIPKRWLDPRLPRMVADDVARLLARAASIEGRAVSPGDVAILTRTNRQALAVQEELRALGVPSVLHGDASVFDSGEAVELARVLAAIAEPGSTMALQSALATGLLGVGAEELHALRDDEKAMEAWIASLTGWRELWERRGFVQAFRRLSRDQAVATRVLGLVDGERRLTNVFHLVELLHQAAVTRHLGIPGLIAWFDEMRHDEKVRQGVMAAESAQIRLESDAEAVQLATMHKSKGLEYPIVYCPWLHESSRLRKNDKRVVRYHDPADGDRMRLHLRPDDAAIAHAETEAHAEAMRLAYVALTRARHRVVVFWGAVNGHENSPLGALLHEGEGGESAGSRLKLGDDAMMRRDLTRLADASGGTIAWRELDETPAPEFTRRAAPALELAAREFRRAPLDRRWRSSSFSALHAAEEAPAVAPILQGIDRDALGDGAPPRVADDRDGEPVVLAGFPRGARPGDLLHRILEHADFAADDVALARVVDAELGRSPFDADKWRTVVARGLSQVLDTPLAADVPGLRLRGVPRSRRVAEMEFVFPVAHAGGALDPRRLAAVFERHARPPLPATYAARVAALGFQPLAGFLRGFIDLVFEHDGRFWVVDYKSNFLGERAGSYRPGQLAPPMLEHDYYLQYHLYTVALHRYLAARLPGYDYDKHVGGVLYLFLRGMAPSNEAGSGVFRDRPSRELVAALSAVLEAPDAREARP